MFRPFLSALIVVLVSATYASLLYADEAEEKKPPAVDDSGMEPTVAALAERVRKSVVIVSFSGRDGKQQGLGTGFVVSSDGLIATNLHVIGEARPIDVQFADGRKFSVIAVHATEKSMDLAVLRIDAKDLTPLELGDSDALKQGEQVIAIGNPLGFRHSVVSGVVSEKRELEGKPMIQVAIPIERGNSGGPLLDMQGRVHGIVTLKSQVTSNLGFAVVVNALKPLLEKPNPIPMSRWTTIGTIDEREWKTVFGARWRQRAGRLSVDEAGTGFGGRSLCLSTMEQPKVPFEVAVSVRFSPEAGAAGLVFQADGKDRHYGFYPSNGRLRLTRFDGPSVYQWKVLEELPHQAYIPNDWNDLKVRIEAERILCYINDELVIESTDSGLTSGAVGLCKFRDTEAEFRRFRVGDKLTSERPSEEIARRISETVTALSVDRPASNELVDRLLPDGKSTSEVLRREAKLLEQRAQRMRELAVAVHARKTQQELAIEVAKKPKDFDLLRAALLLSRIDNEEVDVDVYLREVDQLVEDIRNDIVDDASEQDRLASLDRFLFEQLGFHGSRTNYYHRSNSYLNEVIDDREGLPITLSVLYMELARRLGLKVVGVGLPGHFVVRFEPEKGDSKLIDVFNNAELMTVEAARVTIRSRLDGGVDDEEIEKITSSFLEASPPKAILLRMLSNLRSVAEEDRDVDSILRYLNTALVIDPDSLESRARRIDLQIRTNRIAEALVDIDWMLEQRPAGMDVNQVMQLRADMEARLQQ
ncbi:MAG: trypsin-like peptidase domain-containing protein [Planctomycetota bacterium]|nr:trypsin-like peptidase domain-containing protein [Planctomycetota bacterium]